MIAVVIAKNRVLHIHLELDVLKWQSNLKYKLDYIAKSSCEEVGGLNKAS